MVLETFSSHGTRQLNLASLRLKELPFPGGLVGAETSLGGPQILGLFPKLLRMSCENILWQENRFHPHET
jgi:hypothetical protein